MNFILSELKNTWLKPRRTELSNCVFSLQAFWGLQ